MAGDAAGKVRALYDYRGEKVKEARPGEPVEILGFDRPPPAGRALPRRRARAAGQAPRQPALRAAAPRAARPAARDAVSRSRHLFAQMQEGAVQELNLVLKGDVQGSVEALLGELAKIQHPEVRRQRDPHRGRRHHRERRQPRRRLERTGDRLQRAAERARPSPLAEREGVDIRTYRVIYQLTDDIQQALVGMLSPVSDRGDDRRGRGARAVQGLAARHDRGLHGHAGRRPAQRAGPRRPRRHRVYETSIAQLKRFKDDVARGRRGLRVRHPPRRLQRREGRRRARGLRDARGRAHRSRRSAPPSGAGSIEPSKARPQQSYGRALRQGLARLRARYACRSGAIAGGRRVHAVAANQRGGRSARRCPVEARGTSATPAPVELAKTRL